MPWDANIESKYREVDHYKDLAIELSRLWQKRVTITPITDGSLGCVKSNLYKAVKDLSIESECLSYTLRKTAIPASAYILRRFVISAKLRGLAVYRLVDFRIQYSKHAHVL